MTHSIPRLLAVALLATLPAFLGACRGSAQAAPTQVDPAITVRTAPVTPGPIDHPVRTAGLVATKNQWDLSFKVGGLLAGLRVHEGQRVRKGQVLAALDPTELAAGVRQAEEARDKARRDAARTSHLAASETAPRAAAEDARTAEAMAEAVLAAARFNLRQATLAAPDDGWIDRKLAEPGEVVAAGRPVFHLSGRGRGFVVRAALPDRDVLGLEVGTPARVTIDARPDRPLHGRVAEIASAAGRGTGTYQVEIELDTEGIDIQLLSGLIAKVEIARRVAAAGAVPLAAVVDGDGERGAVFAVDAGVARRVPVQIAFLQGDQAVLAGGVERLRRVVTDGAARLTDGARVTVTE